MNELTTAAKKLTLRQQRALEVLLVGGSDAQAADAARLHKNTVYKLRTTDADFIAALATGRTELLKRTTARLHAATTIAVKALEDVAKDVHNPSARVTAAKAIIEFSHKALELEELEVRIVALEESLAEQKQARSRR